MFYQELMQFFNKLDFNKEEKSIRLKMIKKLYGSGILETLNYFLIKRIMIESNFHRMYFLFISSFFLNLYGFLDSVIKTCFEIFKIFFKRRKDYASTNEIIIFESIGNWIGKIYNMGHTILNKKYFSLKNFSTIGLCNGTFYFQSCFFIQVCAPFYFSYHRLWRSRRQTPVAHLLRRLPPKREPAWFHKQGAP